jgi:hypothetical protein
MDTERMGMGFLGLAASKMTMEYYEGTLWGQVAYFLAWIWAWNYKLVGLGIRAKHILFLIFSSILWHA